MLVIETFLDISLGKGVGLFSKNLIKKGELYWIRSDTFDKINTPDNMASYYPLQIIFIKTYGFLEASGNWYLCIDNARFSNHSDYPNTINHINEKGELLSCSVSKDILPGEEILCDYRDICQSCVIELGFENVE